MKLDEKCPFCAIIWKNAPAEPVWRWEDALAFTPLHPATVGHTLVVPLTHVETIWDLDVDLAQGLVRHVLEVATALRQVANLAGLNVIQSNGIAATQTISHLHIHIVPRYEEDAMGAIWPSASSVSRSDSTRVARALGLKLELQNRK